MSFSARTYPPTLNFSIQTTNHRLSNLAHVVHPSIRRDDKSLPRNINTELHQFIEVQPPHPSTIDHPTTME